MIKVIRYQYCCGIRWHPGSAQGCVTSQWSFVYDLLKVEVFRVIKENKSLAL